MLYIKFSDSIFIKYITAVLVYKVFAFYFIITYFDSQLNICCCLLLSHATINSWKVKVFAYTNGLYTCQQSDKGLRVRYHLPVYAV